MRGGCDAPSFLCFACNNRNFFRLFVLWQAQAADLMSASAMLRARIADLMVANGGADFTDAPTACLAIRYTERTALMGE